MRPVKQGFLGATIKFCTTIETALFADLNLKYHIPFVTGHLNGEGNSGEGRFKTTVLIKYMLAIYILE